MENVKKFVGHFLSKTLIACYQKHIATDLLLFVWSLAKKCEKANWGTAVGSGRNQKTENKKINDVKAATGESKRV